MKKKGKKTEQRFSANKEHDGRPRRKLKQLPKEKYKNRFLGLDE